METEFLQRELAFLSSLGDDQKEFELIFALRDGGVRYTARKTASIVIDNPNRTREALPTFKNALLRFTDAGVKKIFGAVGVKTSVLYHKGGGRASGRTKKQAKNC